MLGWWVLVLQVFPVQKAELSCRRPITEYCLFSLCLSLSSPSFHSLSLSLGLLPPPPPRKTLRRLSGGKLVERQQIYPRLSGCHMQYLSDDERINSFIPPPSPHNPHLVDGWKQFCAQISQSSLLKGGGAGGRGGRRGKRRRKRRWKRRSRRKLRWR